MPLHSITPADESSAGQARISRGLRAGALVVLVLFALAIGGALATAFWAWKRDSTARPAETAVRSGADVVMAVRELARLETASFHMERVIELTNTQTRLFGLVEAEDSILLVAAADVIAGIDLGEMSSSDVRIDESGHVHITLPPPRVLMTRLDSARTFVHSRHTDVMARRIEHLETEARREAERSLERNAIEAGILERAREQAARLIASLAHSLGYVEAEIAFRDTLH